MSDTKKYTTRTASLKATKADIIKLDVKQLTINGEPLNVEPLKSAITIKDERETITENDIWPNPINAEVEHLTSNTDGNIVYQGLTNNTFDYSEMTDAQKAITATAVKVIDNKVLGENDELLMNWDTKSFTNSNNSGMLSIFGDTSNITEWKSDLSSLTDGYQMFALCVNLISFDSDLPSLTYGQNMFKNSALTSFNGDLSSLTDGYQMFYHTALESFNSDLSSLTNGYEMFYYCTNLESFNSDLSSLTHGQSMFYYTALESFNSDLSSLTHGYEMFQSCFSLTSFNSDLSSLTHGGWMFDNCTALTSFNSDLSSLTIGTEMFYNCTKLTSFDSDLSSLTYGQNMFDNCTALTTFDSDLSSLTYGTEMFYKCKLDADSLNNIIHTINDLSDDTNDEEDGEDGWGLIHIGLGYTNTDDSKLAIAKHCCCDSWDELNQEFSDKGWTVAWQFNGSESASNVLNLLDDNETPSTIIWAKLEEVTDEKGHYGYVIEDDTTKHFNIHWYHESNCNNAGYQQFGSLLEACGYFGVIPKE